MTNSNLCQLYTCLTEKWEARTFSDAQVLNIHLSKMIFGSKVEQWNSGSGFKKLKFFSKRYRTKDKSRLAGAPFVKNANSIYSWHSSSDIFHYSHLKNTTFWQYCVKSTSNAIFLNVLSTIFSISNLIKIFFGFYIEFVASTCEPSYPHNAFLFRQQEMDHLSSFLTFSNLVTQLTILSAGLILVTTSIPLWTSTV